MELIFTKEHRYSLIEESKVESSLGALYQALDHQLGRKVAVKCVEIPGETKAQQAANLRLAYAEVSAMIRVSEAAMQTPRVLDTYYDTQKGIFYIVMEWVQGQALRELMRSPEPRFKRWMTELCTILEAMQRQRPQVYHKDIKPDNIMIRQVDDRLMLIDFNISCSLPRQEEGTLHYRAPEMTAMLTTPSRDKVDIFSIGVMLYEYFTGSVPVMGTDYARNRMRGPLVWDTFVAPKEKNPAISQGINDLIVRCMQLDPKARYASMGDLKRDIQRWMRGR